MIAMIKIQRADCPRSLRSKTKAKAAVRKKDVVRALWEMQHKKCAYCEAEIPGEGHLKAVDHFRPKSIFKSRVNDWENLVLACAQCNGRKSDKFPVELTNNDQEPKVVYIKKEADAPTFLIDPTNSEIDPEDHLDMLTEVKHNEFGLIISKNDSQFGRETIEVVGLDSSYHVRKHKKIILKMNLFFVLMLEARLQEEFDIEELYKDKFKLMLSAKGEYTGVARAFARENRLDINFGVRIPTGWETA